MSCPIWMALTLAITAAAIAGDLGPEASKILPGVPPVSFANDRWTPFANCVTSVQDYRGDPVPYESVMGVSGAGFRRFFEKDDGGNMDAGYLTPELQARTFRALGYRWENIPAGDRDAMLAVIRREIDAGRPVLAPGLVGPPEYGVIVGYSSGGDVLHVISQYAQNGGVMPVPVETWHQALAKMNLPNSLTVIGEKTGAPEVRQTLIASLEWAIDLERTPKRDSHPDHAAGLAAMDAWANGLEIDADFPADNREVMERRQMIHGDQCMMIMDRKPAATWLRLMVEHAPEAAEDLKAAADLYQQVGDSVRDFWPWAPGYGPEAIAGLGDPETRRQIAAKVRELRDLEARAVGHLEAALATLEE